MYQAYSYPLPEGTDSGNCLHEEDFHILKTWLRSLHAPASCVKTSSSYVPVCLISINTHLSCFSASGGDQSKREKRLILVFEGRSDNKNHIILRV